MNPVTLPALVVEKQRIMFGLFKKNPVAKLEKQYEKLLKEAMDLQRNGDIKGYAAKMAEAEEIQKKIEALQSD